MTIRMTLPDAQTRAAMLATGMERGMESSYVRLEGMKWFGNVGGSRIRGQLREYGEYSGNRYFGDAEQHGWQSGRSFCVRSARSS
jgi:hypothetical protein